MSRGIVLVDLRIPMQDYKYVHIAVLICATLVNTHAHTLADSFHLVTFVLSAQLVIEK